jgi:hypothetical protein
MENFAQRLQSDLDLAQHTLFAGRPDNVSHLTLAFCHV